MRFFTEKYDEDFREIGKDENNPQEIGEYNFYPQMIPWVGNQYENGNHKRILLIGESHYLPDEVDDELKMPNGWYYQEENDLDDKSRSWTNTREVVGLGPAFWTKGHSLYREINKIIAATKGTNAKSQNMFQYVAFYNYFLRPAHPQGASFKGNCEDIDRNVAKGAFLDILQILKPDYVYFFSKFAWDTLHQKEICFENIEMDYSPHPASPWWNREKYRFKDRMELLTGKEKFMTFLSNNQVF